MSANLVAVASYNMSFVSDKLDDIRTMDFASEIRFLHSNKALWELVQRNETVPPIIRRQYWENAKQHLKNFILEQETNGLTCVIGLQEMNKTLTPDPETGIATGSYAINLMLQEINETNNTNYIQICDLIKVINKDELALSVIYDVNKFGKPKHVDIWDSLNEDGKAAGRLTLLVVTENDYVFVSTHGQNVKGKATEKEVLNEKIITYNKNALQTAIVQRLQRLEKFQNFQNPTVL